MKEGIKLYKQFQDLLKEAGNINIAWFTTFNLEVSFFERYVLSALANLEPEHVRTVSDYEALNEILFGQEVFNSNIDVRVFHDYRALGLKEVKKTTVQIIGIDPDKYKSKFRGGVFHPKVCLIVNDQDEVFIMTGSANLTISGWGRNSESIAVKKVEDVRNARQIVQFYQGFVDQPGRRLLAKLLQKWENQMMPESDWEFHHSFLQDSFIDKLHLEGSSLYVWSPYFSENLKQICEENLQGATHIEIIPDYSADGQIRIDHDLLEYLIENPRIGLSRIRAVNTEIESFVHAKIWLTRQILATGSWNFSGAAIGLGKNNNNIEAGIIQTIHEENFKSILGSFNLTDYEDKCQGQERQDLDADRNTVLNPWIINCSVIADWDTYLYHLNIEKDIKVEEFEVELPGIDQRIDLRQMLDTPVSFYKKNTRVLRDRIFTVYKTNGEKAFVGILVEINVKVRPAMGFEHIRDFINGWIEGQPEKRKDLQRANYKTDFETGEEVNESAIDRMAGNYDQAWFNMFLAIERMKSRLSEASTSENNLRILGYQIPGSISQLKVHLDQVKKDFEEGDPGYTEAFVWFLIHEGNQVIKGFNSIKGKIFKENTDYLDISFVENIKISFDKSVNRKGARWLKYIEKECSY